MTSFDSIGGLDQAKIKRTETREINEIFAEKPSNKLKLYLDQSTQTMRWKEENNDFPEIIYTEDKNPNEVEVDLTGEGNGKPILGVTDEGTFQVLSTTESEEPFRYPEGINDIVDLNSGKWDILPDNQGIVKKQ